METVFIVVKSTACEGDNICSVHASKQSAEHARSEILEAAKERGFPVQYPYSVNVYEMEVTV